MFTPSEPVLWPGRPYRLGSTWDGEGDNFAPYSERAEKVELCLFDNSGRRENLRIPLPEQTDMVWHGYLPEVRPGQLYGYRVSGPYAREQGHRWASYPLQARSLVVLIERRDSGNGNGRKEDANETPA
jgi:isoamylase